MSQAYTLLDAVYAAARWGSYLAAFLVLGASSYAPFLFAARTGLAATHPEVSAAISRRAARIGLWAAAALLALHALRLYLQSRTLLDPSEPLTRDFLGAVLGSAWGKGWIRQELVAALALAGFAWAARGARTGWMVAAGAAGGVGLVAGMTGHAAAERGGLGGMLLDAAHMWAGGLWLGGLAVLVMAGIGALSQVQGEERKTLLRALVGDFSRRALLYGPLAVALGAALAVWYLGWRWPLQLFAGSYESALGVKLLLLVGVAAAGAFNWRVAQPRLGGEGGEEHLRRATRLELLFGALLLGATAVLVALPFPGDGM